MFDDITTTIKAQLYERVTSPLLGSFVISWCLINYKTLLIIFSSLPAPDKINYIELNLFTSINDYLVKGVMGPLIAALFLILIYPYPAAVIYRASRNHKKHLKEIQQEIDDQTPLTREDARKIRKNSARIQIELEAELERKNNEAASLKQLNSQLIQDIENGRPKEELLASALRDLDKERHSHNETVSSLNDKIKNYENYLHRISNSTSITSSGRVITQDLDTQTLSNRASASILTPEALNLFNGVSPEQAIPQINEYVKDLKIFGDHDYVLLEVNGKIVSEYLNSDNKKVIHTWGDIDPLNHHKSILEIQRKMKLHRDNKGKNNHHP